MFDEIICKTKRKDVVGKTRFDRINEVRCSRIKSSVIFFVLFLFLCAQSVSKIKSLIKKLPA